MLPLSIYDIIKVCEFMVHLTYVLHPLFCIFFQSSFFPVPLFGVTFVIHPRGWYHIQPTLWGKAFACLLWNRLLGSVS